MVTQSLRSLYVAFCANGDGRHGTQIGRHASAHLALWLRRASQACDLRKKKTIDRKN